MKSTCFVLEGGALRGLYTSGVLDYLYEQNVDTDCIIGVSAGALFGVNYFSDQPGRVLRYNLKYCNDKRYMSVRSLLLTGNIVNKSFAYYKVSYKLDPFDEKKFINTNKDFYAVLTNVETGLPEYVKITKPLEQMEELRATSAMPFVTRIVNVNGKKYLDGAVTDSIPVLKALEMNYDKVVVVLTQPYEYRKKELTSKELKKAMKKYEKYPYFVKDLFERPKMYNETLEKITELEKEGRIFVLRPSESVEINPIKKDENDLKRAYNLGKKDAKANYKKLIKYLKQ